MSFNNENVVPLQEDLTVETPLLEIIRGLEGLMREDIALADGESFAEGDWGVINADYELEAPGATASHACVPVWAGNAEGRSDVIATGKVTVLRRARPFIYRTTKFNTAETYAVGDALTVKDLGAGEKVPTKATGSDAILARVSKIVSESVLEIEVVSN